MAEYCNQYYFSEDNQDHFEVIPDQGDSFQSWQGLRGPYYSPTVGEDGYLYWTNNGGLPNPEPVKIVGQDGRGITLTGQCDSTAELPDDPEDGEAWAVGEEEPFECYAWFGEWVDLGPMFPKGDPGADGVSPEVTITDITGGHTVKITDKDHPTGQTFNIMDGQDGVSPTVTVTDITGGHRVTITDKDHPTGQTFNVMDGQDGDPGPGVPSGGSAGQLLKKSSSTDYATEWYSPGAGDISYSDQTSYAAGTVGDGLNGLRTSLNHYVTCSTAAGTQIKDVTINGLSTLPTGLEVRVKFTNAQTYNGQPKLRVNNGTEKGIVRNGTTAAAQYEWRAGEVVDFVYDGTNFVIVDGGTASTSYYGQTKLSSSGASTSETVALTPKALNSTVNGLISDDPVYSSSSTYAVGDVVRYSFKLWRCTTAITTAESWDAEHWEELPPLNTALNNLDSDDIANASTNVSGATVTAAVDNLKVSLNSAESGSAIRLQDPAQSTFYAGTYVWRNDVLYKVNNTIASGTSASSYGSKLTAVPNGGLNELVPNTTVTLTTSNVTANPNVTGAPVLRSVEGKVYIGNRFVIVDALFHFNIVDAGKGPDMYITIPANTLPAFSTKSAGLAFRRESATKTHMGDSVAISHDANSTIIKVWEQNQFAYRVQSEYAYVVIPSAIIYF